jgi:hypothetical protein
MVYRALTEFELAEYAAKSSYAPSGWSVSRCVTSMSHMTYGLHVLSAARRCELETFSNQKCIQFQHIAIKRGRACARPRSDL